jgi:Pentapeptide repeats (8 copies)
LIGSHIPEAILSGADLRGAHLSHADLVGADLRGANLSGAILSGAILHFADLSGANLFDADLRDADLRAADLSRALNVTQNQLAPACGDSSTELPSGLTIKKECKGLPPIFIFPPEGAFDCSLEFSHRSLPLPSARGGLTIC